MSSTLYWLFVMSYMSKQVVSLKCFSGQVIIGHPSASELPVQRTNCEEPTDICISIYYNMSFPIDPSTLYLVNVSSLQGACGLSDLGCDFICKRLKESLATVKGCQSYCCSTDYCNKDVGERYMSNKQTLVVNKVSKDEIKKNNKNNTSNCSDCSPSSDIKITVETIVITVSILLSINSFIT